jgi:hypothetical protein
MRARRRHQVSDPVIFFGRRRSSRRQGEGSEESETLPLGARRWCVGGALTLIAYGAMVRVALEGADPQEEDGVETTVIDLLTISPSIRRRWRSGQTDRARGRHHSSTKITAGRRIAIDHGRRVSRSRRRSSG